MSECYRTVVIPSYFFFCWVGAAGAVVGRHSHLLIGALGQFLLGFWNFTIGLFMLPVGTILIVIALLVLEDANE